MTGQAYTLKEMKAIVDYLKDKKLYGEIKGRKMWMNYASSQLTTRTWQSLKETFLKRILPDLHNPYYNLTIEQINSFRSGYDISERNKNKLEIHTVSDDSDGQQNNLPPTSNGSDKEQENNAGEAMKSSKVPLRNRSSADTVIVDTCYETAEDIQKELESPGEKKENGETKSLRDCITYSEPLTPMLQEVIDDFQSEPENEPETSDRENALQIVEQPDIENLENISNEVSEIVKANHHNDKSGRVETATNSSEKGSGPTVADGKADTNLDSSQPKAMPDSQSNTEENKISCSKNTKENDSEALLFHNSDHEEKNEESKINEEPTRNKTANCSKEQVQKAQIKNPDRIPSSGLLNNSTTPDASLPNNPEALEKRVSNDDKCEPSENSNEKRNTRKRLISDNAVKVKENKKSKLDLKKIKANSENESSQKAEKTVPNVKAKSVEPMGKPNENDSTKEKRIEITKFDRILEKPSTSKSYTEKKILTSETDRNRIENESLETKNPCLKNLSLYNEQFNKTKYNSSGTSDVDQNKKGDLEKDKDKNTCELQNESVRIKSNTESDVEEVKSSPNKKRRPGVVNVNLEKERGLANVFGFSSGAAHSKRKRRLSRRRRTISQNISSQNNGGSNSSEWTSESDSEVYVSPPRGKKNRSSKKYLKPQSARIHSLEEEGGLFVMYGRKIYPLIKDGKLVKRYLSYQPESESDEENYWKLKYVEEKKKSAELKKLLQESKVPKASTSKTSPVRPNRTSNTDRDQAQESSNNNDGVVCLPGVAEKKEVKINFPQNIKIKFTTKNDQEIHLEGNWNQLQNALEHVVHIFDKEPEPISVSKPNALITVPSSSGIASPVDVLSIEESVVDPGVIAETHDKVDKIEDKIFKEIEEIDRKERLPSEELTNVTKRRGRRATVSSSTSESASKRMKTSDQLETPETPQKAPEPLQKTPEAQNPVEQQNTKQITYTPVKNKDVDETPKKRLRTPRKSSNESSNTYGTESTRMTRKSTLKLNTSNIEAETNEDQEIRYMLPPQNKRQSLKTADKKTKAGLKKSMLNARKTHSSPEISSQTFVESTQDYQDSDPSPMQNERRKKKKIKSSILKTKYLTNLRRSTRNKPGPFIYYNDSSLSSNEMSGNKIENNNSTINTEVYRSESYQILMPSAKPSAVQRLDSIEEIDVIEYFDSTENNELCANPMNIDPFNCDSDQTNCEVGSSSQISLPLSPELSVVESLSISKDMLDMMEVESTVIETQHQEKNTETDNKFLISDVNVPVSPMRHKCTFEKCQVLNENKSDYQTTEVTDSLLNKVRTCEIEERNNLTDTLNVKLKDLLLDSAKKIASQNIQDKIDSMEVDVSYKTKPKKRCSTPRKRRDSQKSKKKLKIHNVIEEEHIQNCSHGGRKSCPPIIETVPIVADEELNISSLTIEKIVKPKGRKKKDVIKVKIIRPKSKKSRQSITEQTKDIMKDNVTKSILCNDSGINNTESEDFLAVDESIDLIHNHSDTCLQTNQCIEESVEFVDNSRKSILTLSDSQSQDSTWCSQCNFNDAEVVSADFFSNDAQDVRSFYRSKQDKLNASDTVYHSPIGTDPSSLITEDLSDDVSPPVSRFEKWYLLSEDESTNINIGNEQRTTNTSSFGSNLKQIFPISCAVPDLSTITEMSKENEDFNQRSIVESVTSD